MGFNFVGEDENGNIKEYNKFIPVAEAKMYDTQMQSIEAALMYGKKSTRQSDYNGYVKRTGSGLREQLKDSWNLFYSGSLTTTLLTDYLMNIFFARKDENQRKVTLHTGTMGSVN